MLIDPERFERCFLDWVRSVFRPDAGAPRQIAIDGKTVRRSFDRRNGRSPLHLVSAFAVEHGLVVGAACHGGQAGRAFHAAQPARRPGPARLFGQPGRTCPPT
jgi:hypothetical protein